MGRHGDWRDSPSEVRAGSDEEGGESCALGARCYERDYAGNAKMGPRAFCETDRRWVERSIRDLPEDYTCLWFLLVRTSQQAERVSGSKDNALPIAADIDAFMREIVHVALSWETEVRCMARLTDIPDGHRRMGVELSQACQTLTRQFGTLLALPPRDVMRFAARRRVRELAEQMERGEQAGLELPEPWIRWDTSGDAWEYKSMDGTAAALELLGLHGRARGMLGLTPQRRRITEVRCDGCQGKAALVQREGPSGGWLPVVSCTMCPNVYTGARYDLLMGRIYQAQMAALETAGHTRRGERAAV